MRRDEAGDGSHPAATAQEPGSGEAEQAKRRRLGNDGDERFGIENLASRKPLAIHQSSREVTTRFGQPFTY